VARENRWAESSRCYRGLGGGTRAWPTARPTTGQIQRQLAHLVQSNHVCTATKLSTTNTWVPAGYCSSSPCKFQNKELSRLCTLRLLADQNSKISYNFKLVLPADHFCIFKLWSLNNINIYISSRCTRH
jgi:hypothetical protein